MSKFLHDNGGRRSVFDRRKFPYKPTFLERRSGKERRSGNHRRLKLRTSKE